MTERVPAERPWDGVGYSRAVRSGSTIEVAGTSATTADGQVLYPGDPYGQTRHCLEIMAAAINKLGGELKDVVRTRAYLTHIDQWREVGRAHAEFFSEIKPASTFVEVSGLLDPELLVELEATAIVPKVEPK